MANSPDWQLMALKLISYVEWENDPRYWRLEPVEFGLLTLMVGKNATGKSRVLSVVVNLCSVLAGMRTTAYLSGTWHAELEVDGVNYKIDLASDSGKVVEERLEVNGVERLRRGANGEGEIWFSKEQKNISFQMPESTFAICTKNDKLQHPFVAALSDWARGASFYPFGTDLGKSLAMPMDDALEAAENAETSVKDANNIVEAYVRAFKRYGEAYDKAVISDMARLGYYLTDVSAAPLQDLPKNFGPRAPIVVYVTERDLGVRVPQIHLSQGMYRALALVIHLQWAIFSGERRLFLVDDIGEGLDFDRATKLIELVVERAKALNIQAVLTSNDRFVMNAVPLEYWAVLSREKATVRAFTPKNSPKAFEDFKFVGLSNFDFFAGGNYH